MKVSRQEYIDAMKLIYLAANESDSYNPSEWMHGNECALHCIAIESIVKDMKLDENWWE
jgi:hypothetical protein